MNGQAPHIQNQTAPGISRPKVFYWVYWVTSYFTVLTWLLAVLAAGLDSWVKTKDYGDEYVTLAFSSCGNTYNDMCPLYKAAHAFQYMATIAITFTPPVIVIASFASAWNTSRLGLALGITLAVFSVLELIAFSAGAAFYSEVDDIYALSWDVVTGPSLGLAVTAWIFGVAGTVLILTLRTKATTDQDGPLKKFLVPPQQQPPVPPTTFPQFPTQTMKGPPPAFTEGTV